MQTRVVRLVNPSGRQASLRLTIVERLTGAAGLCEVTAEQERLLRTVEQANGGKVPVTDDEWDALVEGRIRQLAELASRRGSNLRLLFCWGEAESGRNRKRQTLSQN